eukprot:GILK01005990.1.p1 GENE.GILK01005990.1~~GILK01005990.1.p1  ORF type:complete len:387 (+),score=85.20 GILK01005990.1:44-1162(+)
MAGTPSSMMNLEELRLQGVELLNGEHFDAAIQHFEKTLQDVVGQFGEMSNEAAPFYYFYGDALLAKLETSGDVFGSAAATENADEAEDDEEAINAAEDDTTPTTEGQAQGEGQAQTEEQIEDLQVAWEVLETARLIYSKQGPHSNKDLAKTHQRLGDLKQWQENFEAAIEEYTECLKIRTSMDGAGSRSIAETHYLLGLAYMFSRNQPQAQEHFQRAFDILEQQLEQLQAESGTAQTESKGKGKVVAVDRSARFEAKAEDPANVAELKSVLRDLCDKMEELNSALLLDSEASSQVDSKPQIPSSAVVTPQPLPAVTSASSTLSEPITTSSFSAATCSAPVVHLGVVGRSTKRTSEGEVVQVKRVKLTEASST